MWQCRFVQLAADAMFVHRNVRSMMFVHRDAQTMINGHSKRKNLIYMAAVDSGGVGCKSKAFCCAPVGRLQ